MYSAFIDSAERWRSWRSWQRSSTVFPSHANELIIHWNFDYMHMCQPERLSTFQKHEWQVEWSNRKAHTLQRNKYVRTSKRNCRCFYSWCPATTLVNEMWRSFFSCCTHTCPSSTYGMHVTFSLRKSNAIALALVCGVRKQCRRFSRSRFLFFLLFFFTVPFSFS